MTKSNFWRYFRYNLSKRRASIIIFALLNFVSTLLPAILFTNALRQVAKEVLIDNKHVLIGTPDGLLPFMFYVVPINIILSIVMTIKSFKIYYKRPAMDTLGSLPLSYKERFWGDFLGAVFLNFVSFVPMYLVSLIFLGNMKRYTIDIFNGTFNGVYGLDLTMIPTSFSSFWFMLLLMYLGVYGATALVCSCCGKKSSSILYTIILMVAFPGIFWVYAGYMLSNVIGIDAIAELTGVVSMIPPLGPVVSAIMASDYEFTYPLDNMLGLDSFKLAVFLLIIAAFIAGAYFIGKLRRAERVGESFAFKSAYHVLTLMFMILLIGGSFLGYSNLMDNFGVFAVLPITFIVYAALEISQNKGFKGFWKTVVRFAAVFGACFAFITLVKTTNSFGLYKRLPSAESVKEVRIWGNYFYTPWSYNDYKKYIFDDKQSVSAFLEEHKKLFNSDSLKTGKDIMITYVTKTGQNVTRRYSVENGDALKNFSRAVKELPDFDFGSLGVIDEPDAGKYDISLDIRKNPTKFIRADREERFMELLRYDIKNNFNGGLEIYGWVFFTENNERRDYSKAYIIFPTYESTIEFLEDPDNFELSREMNETDNYRIDYSKNNVSVCVNLSTEDTSAAAKELLSYIKPKSEDNSYDSRNGVRIQSSISGVYYTIDPADEEAVLKAMLVLFREKNINKD